jgi:Trypsin-co-occurring domain 2
MRLLNRFSAERDTMNADEDSEPGIPLAEAISDLRSQLWKAISEGKNQDLRFKLDPVELELNVGMTYKGGANAGVKFWVVDVGAKGDIERTGSHRLKLKLTPVDKDGNQFMVRDTVTKMPE